MTQVRFFQVSLSLPLALWAVGLITVSLLSGHDNEAFRQNLYHGHHIFLPYLIFAAVVWKLVNNKTYGRLMFMAFAVPLLWGCFFTLWYVAATYVVEGVTQKWFVLLIMAFWAAVVGYLCEAIPLYILSKFRTKFKALDQPANANAK